MKQIIILGFMFVMMSFFVLGAAGDPNCFINATGGKTACVGGNLGVGNFTGIVYTPQICLGGDCKTTWPISADGNNYTTSVSFNGTTIKQINIARNGMSNLTATFTDIDTDTWNTTAQMRAAVNNSGQYNISINASNILNAPWITSYTETDPLSIKNGTSANLTIVTANRYNLNGSTAYLSPDSSGIRIEGGYLYTAGNVVSNGYIYGRTEFSNDRGNTILSNIGNLSGTVIINSSLPIQVIGTVNVSNRTISYVANDSEGGYYFYSKDDGLLRGALRYTQTSGMATKRLRFETYYSGDNFDIKADNADIHLQYGEPAGNDVIIGDTGTAGLTVRGNINTSNITALHYYYPNGTELVNGGGTGTTENYTIMEEVGVFYVDTLDEFKSAANSSVTSTKKIYITSFFEVDSAITIRGYNDIYGTDIGITNNITFINTSLSSTLAFHNPVLFECSSTPNTFILNLTRYSRVYFAYISSMTGFSCNVNASIISPSVVYYEVNDGFLTLNNSIILRKWEYDTLPVTGSNQTVVTGIAGVSGHLAAWDSGGNIVDGGTGSTDGTGGWTNTSIKTQTGYNVVVYPTNNTVSPGASINTVSIEHSSHVGSSLTSNLNALNVEIYEESTNVNFSNRINVNAEQQVSYSGGYTGTLQGFKFVARTEAGSGARVGQGIGYSSLIYNDDNDAYFNKTYDFYAYQDESQVANLTKEAYGLYIENKTKAVTNYAIYTNEGKVHFGDNLEFASGKGVDSQYITNTPAECVGENYFMTRYGGSTSICKQVNASLFNITGNSGWTANTQNTTTYLKPRIFFNSTKNGEDGMYVEAIATSLSAQSMTALSAVITNSQNNDPGNKALTGISSYVAPNTIGVSITDIVGVESYPYFNSGANSTIGSMTGFYSSFQMVSNTNSTFANIRNFYASGFMSGTPGVVNYTQFYGSSLVATTNDPQNHYGMYLEDVNQGTVLNYAIYTNAGKVRFGDSLNVSGDIYGRTGFKVNATGIYMSTDGSTASSPRVLQFVDYDGSEAIGYLFDNSNGMINHYSAASQMFGYHSVVIRGDRGSTTLPGIDYDSDASLVIETSQAASISQRIKGATSQTGHYLVIENSTGTDIVTINATGTITTTTGDIVQSETKKHCWNLGCSSYTYNNGYGVITV